MITHNPYNLPDKILKQNQIAKPINLQNKKSRDKSYEYSKEISNKGIKIQSQMKKSINLQHVSSSPNLHNISASTNSNRPIQYQSVNRSNEYHQTANSVNESQMQKRVKYLFQKFYSMNEQIINHENILSKLHNQRQRNDRSVWQSPLLYQINTGVKQGKQKQQQQGNRNGHLNHNQLNNQNHINYNNNTQINTHIQILKKQIYLIKQQLSQIKNQNKEEGINITKSIKLNGSINLNNQYETINPQKNKNFQINFNKFQQQILKLTQSIEQIKNFNQDKINKIEINHHKLQTNLLKLQGNHQMLIHKGNKSQQRIQNLQTNIEKHMNLVNQQINNSLSKIVNSINQKITKALDNNISVVNQKIKKYSQNCKNVIEQNKIESQNSIESLKSLLNTNNSAQNLQKSIKKSKYSPPKNIDFDGKKIITSFLKVSSFKSELPSNKLSIRTLVSQYNQNSQKNDNIKQNGVNSSQKSQILVGNQIYYIDSQGYLLDEQKYYLLDENNMIIKLEQKLVQRLRQNKLLRQF